MQGYNLLVIFSKDEKSVLMCKRRKDPYQGLSNFIGGKIEVGEDSTAAAYRELYEEASLTDKDVTLKHFADFTYYYCPCVMEIYVGKIKTDAQPHGDENDLYWSDFDHNFFDSSKYAGEGNMGHILEEIFLIRDRLLSD